jgi:serine/threonine protein kinase
MSLRSTSAIYENFTISNFTIKEQLGSGKFGIVYRAIEKYSEREVAIKIILKKTITSSTLHKQLQREI